MGEFIFSFFYFFITFGLVVVSIVIVRKNIYIKLKNSLVTLMILRKEQNFWQKLQKIFQV